MNGHVTFVAPRVGGQVSRVLVDDNNRVRKGELLAELDKEPYQIAVSEKKAAVDTAKADLQAASADGARYRGTGQEPALETAERRGGRRQPDRSVACSGCCSRQEQGRRWRWRRSNSIGQSKLVTPGDEPRGVRSAAGGLVDGARRRHPGAGRRPPGPCLVGAAAATRQGRRSRPGAARSRSDLFFRPPGAGGPDPERGSARRRPFVRPDARSR